LRRCPRRQVAAWIADRRPGTHRGRPCAAIPGSAYRSMPLSCAI
jgi:hypothetical protein